MRPAAKHAICFGVVYEGNATTNTVWGQLAGADQTPNGAFGDVVAFGNSADAAALATCCVSTPDIGSLLLYAHICAVVRDSDTLRTLSEREPSLDPHELKVGV